MENAAIMSAPAQAAPRKLFYRIQEVAKMTGLKPYVLRYWESEFKELAPEKDASEQRRYRQGDVEVILAIRKLLYEERYTIQGARKRLREELRRMRGQAPAEAVAAPILETAAEPEQLVLLPVPAPVQTPSEASTRGTKIDRSLRHLRHEVNELLNLLSA